MTGAPSTKPISGGDLKDPRRPRPHAPDRLIEVLSPKRARAVPRSETRQPQGLATPPPGEGGCRHRFESPPDIGLVETTAGTRPSGAEAGVKERAWAVARAIPDGSNLVRHCYVCTKIEQSRPEVVATCFENNDLKKILAGTALALTPRHSPCRSAPCPSTT